MSRISDLMYGNASNKQRFVKKEDKINNIVNFINQTADLVDEITSFMSKNVEQDKNSSKCQCAKAVEPQQNSQNQKAYGEYVNHPAHYAGHKFEAIDIIEDFDLGFNLGNALKYLLRCNKKWNKAEDLKKAIWYLNRELSNCENN